MMTAVRLLPRIPVTAYYRHLKHEGIHQKTTKTPSDCKSVLLSNLHPFVIASNV